MQNNNNMQRKDPEFSWNLVQWSYAKNKIATIIAVIFYSISPVDLVFDIPIVGWLDDSILVICLLNEIKKDLSEKQTK